MSAYDIVLYVGAKHSKENAAKIKQWMGRWPSNLKPEDIVRDYQKRDYLTKEDADELLKPHE